MAQRTLLSMRLLPPLLLLLLAPLLEAGIPPTTATSATDRQYILVFDAGSTGTRLFVFEFRLDGNHSTGLQIISMKDQNISPGLSAYADTPERLRSVLKPLMEFGRDSVPAVLHARTTVIVRATAGLRSLNDRQRRGIIRVVAEVLRRSTFRVPEPNSVAVRVITGQEEAEYGWVAVNFLMNAFDQPGGDTYGMLDLGGGSTQITFVPKVDDTGDSYRVVFKTVRGRSYALHEHSYLGLGMSQARLHMLGYTKVGPWQREYRSPCLSPRFAANFSFGLVTVQVAGDKEEAKASDRLSRCLAQSRIPLTKVPVHQPPGVKVAKFVAVGSFFYTASLLQAGGFWDRKIPGNATVSDLAAAAGRVCADPPVSGEHEPYLCMSTQFIVTLLREGYRFSDDQSLFITDKIKDYSAGWPLGIAIHHLTCHDSSGHACLDSGAAGGGPPAGLWAALAAACVAVLTKMMAVRPSF